jgi:hypothetical protein
MEIPSVTDALVTTVDELIEALRSRKDELGLSNAFVEAQLQMADGHCDKLLGPTRRKGMSVAVLLDIIELFGAQLVIQVDAETEARMRERWERRDGEKSTLRGVCLLTSCGSPERSYTWGSPSSGTKLERQSFPRKHVRVSPVPQRFLAGNGIAQR